MRSDRWRWISVSATVLALTSCATGEQGETGAVVDAEPVDDTVVRSAVSPPPISGGTLLMIEDGDTAVAADPERDLVHVVDLLKAEVRHTVALPTGDEPGRLVADAEGLVHVAARRGGVVVDLDPRTGAILGRRAVCPNPRGIAYEPELDVLHVACAGGELVSLPAAEGEPLRRVKVAPDLRDVLVTREGLHVSRFRSATLLRLDEHGSVVEQQRPPTLDRTVFLNDVGNDRLRSTSAWRTVATPDGDWLMLHQASTMRAVSLEEHDQDGETGDDGVGDDGVGDDGGGGGYGGRDPEQCDGVVHPLVTLGKGIFDTRHSSLLRDTVLPVDVAVAKNGHMVLAVAGKRTHEEERLRGGVVSLFIEHFTTSELAGCTTPEPVKLGDGQYVAVAFDRLDRVVAQSREPAHLACVTPGGHTPTIIELPGEPRRDTGHDLFHLDAGAGIACATCHPEGGDDGFVWSFEGIGPRHTPALTIGLAGTQPFHWEGDLADMSALAEEVHEGRMGGSRLSQGRVEALQSWMFAMAQPQPLRTRQDDAVARGEALFAAWGCGGCHTGAALAGNASVDLGLGVRLQVPGLHGVALHPPYMHDGRAADLHEAVRDMLLRTRPGAAMPADEELDDIVAYLESL